VIKAQSFGFDVLLTLTVVLIFGQLLYLYSLSEEPSILTRRRVENNQLLYLALQYNNSLAYFDSYTCNGNFDSFEEFNSSVLHVLDSYLSNREYLLVANGIIYSSEGVKSVCLEKALPTVIGVNSSCGSVLNLEFSIYTKGEKTPC
jgi:hypothetical protein